MGTTLFSQKYLFLRGSIFYIRVQNPDLCFSLKTRDKFLALKLRDRFESLIQFISGKHKLTKQILMEIKLATLNGLTPELVSERLTKSLRSHDKYQNIEDFAAGELEAYSTYYTQEKMALDIAIKDYEAANGEKPTKKMLELVQANQQHIENKNPLGFLANLVFMLQGTSKFSEWKSKTSLLNLEDKKEILLLLKDESSQETFEITQALTEAIVERDFFKKYYLKNMLNEDLVFSSTSVKHQEPPAQTLEEILLEFLEYESQKKIKPMSKDRQSKFYPTVRLITWALGNKPINRYEHHEIDEFFHKSCFHLHNRCLREKEPYYKMGYKKVLELDFDEDEAYSQTMISKHQQRFNQIIKWALERGKYSVNPLANVKQLPQGTDSTRALFTERDLATIFSPKLYNKLLMTSAWHYWIPIFSFITGARPHEIGQLRKKDITFVGERCYLNLVNEGENRIKNVSSQRKIPLSKYFDTKGFKAFVGSLGLNDEDRVWRDLNTYGDGYYSAKIRNWFMPILPTIGVDRYDTNENKKQYYSFRHQFFTYADAVNEESAYKAYTGHTRGKGSSKGYIGKTEMKNLERFIDKLDFSVIRNIPNFSSFAF